MADGHSVKGLDELAPRVRDLDAIPGSDDNTIDSKLLATGLKKSEREMRT